MRRTAPPLRQRILITGASSGLGEQMARVWAAAGRDLALCARRVPEIERLRDELRSRYPGVRVVTRSLDVNDPTATEAAFAECAAELGGLDRVVANAGLIRGGPIGTGAAVDNRATAQTNFVGMVNQAEAAVAALGKGLRSELWTSAVSVSVIHPGWIRTPLTEGHLQRDAGRGHPDRDRCHRGGHRTGARPGPRAPAALGPAGPADEDVAAGSVPSDGWLSRAERGGHRTGECSAQAWRARRSASSPLAYLPIWCVA